MKIIKRLFNLIFTILIVLICIFVDARYIEPELLQVKKLNIDVEQDIPPIKIVFFTDTHIGKHYNQMKMVQIVDKINAQNPDVVVFGGDFFDSYYKDANEINTVYLSNELARINATYAKVAVWGNHDIGGAGAKPYEELMHAGGFVLLQNEQMYLEPFNLVIRGLDDYLLGNPDKSTQMLPEVTTNIIVSHAPDIVDELDLSNVDMVIAGHSHGGQVFIPGITERILPPGAKKYKKGIYDLTGNRDTKLYVSQGIGLTQIPYRFLNIPEIVSITLE